MVRRTLIFSSLILLALNGCASPTVTPAPTFTPLPTDLPTAAPSATVAPATVIPEPPPPTASPTATLEPTAEPTLPPVPEGMLVERLAPPQYAVRLTAPGANIRQAPTAAAETLTKLECGAAPLTVDAAAYTSPNDPKWYHVLEGEGGWVREDVVKVYASADEAASAAQSAACGSSNPSPGTKTGSDYTPTVAQIWNFVQSPDNMTGTCTGGAILPPYGLVKLAPAGTGALEWRSQEPTPYLFTRSGANTYSYTGPTALGDGTVTLLLTFTSSTTATMSRAFVPTDDPGCTHTHTYSAEYQWDAQ